MALKQQVSTVLPIEFSEVCEVLYQDTLGTNGRTLMGAFAVANADLANRGFDPLYVGVKDRLTNWRGYPIAAYKITVVGITDLNTSPWTSGGTTLVGHPWSNIQNAIAGTNMTDGLTNTNTIVNQSGHIYSSAKDCLDYSFGGFSDWFLPAENTTLLFYTLKSAINATCIANGGTALINTYISSTEVSGNQTTSINVNNNSINDRLKSSRYPCRPIREFNASSSYNIGDFIGGGVVIKVEQL